ncbi:phosphopantetheinyl transferase [Pedobacter sp. KBW06]|uniref:4'-phosphopantetheinyl transferase family protein n=1 Tax=Pedobacter sp. KBW06 TaxID=2153359 RepID=UPI000F5AF187|nr:4'-phosphopantetheinyl transferase superfamily protein [Pedobacter sp. KBW06]RQO70067.1 phosphopantetheinyl transferase [Pedobacter sp. KBW06]
MIGNDIVDLLQADAESNWRRKGYLQKVFSSEEQQLIHSASNPCQMVWLLWSMKEAVYKIHSRKKNWQAFAPGKLYCSEVKISGQCASGVVTCQRIRYFTQSSLCPDFIHTIAGESFPIEAASIRISSYDPSDLSYRNTAPATVSHHGRYLALAYL